MKVSADISVVPLGVGVSLSEYIVACERIFRDIGLHPHVHAFGTNVEGEWEQVFSALQQCHEKLHSMGVPRVSTTLRMSTRTDKDQTLEDKVRSVEAKLPERATKRYESE